MESNLAAIGFPVIIMLLIPLRVFVIPRLPFTSEELAILDQPTASPFVSFLYQVLFPFPKHSFILMYPDTCGNFFAHFAPRRWSLLEDICSPKNTFRRRPNQGFCVSLYLDLATLDKKTIRVNRLSVWYLWKGSIIIITPEEISSFPSLCNGTIR